MTQCCFTTRTRNLSQPQLRLEFAKQSKALPTIDVRKHR